jgi:hypothetical protein
VLLLNAQSFVGKIDEYVVPRQSWPRTSFW